MGMLKGILGNIRRFYCVLRLRGHDDFDQEILVEGLCMYVMSRKEVSSRESTSANLHPHFVNSVVSWHTQPLHFLTMLVAQPISTSEMSTTPLPACLAPPTSFRTRTLHSQSCCLQSAFFLCHLTFLLPSHCLNLSLPSEPVARRCFC